MSRRPATYGSVVVRLVAALVALALLVAPAGPAAAVQAEQDQWWYSTWQMQDVWQISDGSGVTVAVLDTGVDASVSELAGAVVPGTDLTDEASDGTVDTDSQGSGHGTSMATLIASRGGESGLVGVAPGATILPIVAPTESTLWLEEGIRYATDNGAQVINISQGNTISSSSCPLEVAEAVRYAVSHDVVVVASSGNEAGGADEFPGRCAGVVTAGAVDQGLEPWENTHRSEYVAVAAPGVGIYDVARGGVVTRGNGTSVASALVSGVAALLRAEYPDASAREIVARLLFTVQDVAESGRDDATGYGFVRPYEALTASVPQDAPNPIYDALDLEAEPTPEGPPPVVSDGGGERFQLPAWAGVLMLIGCLLVLVAAILLPILLVARRRRQRRATGYPGMPPPYHPGFPAGPPGAPRPGPPPPPRR